MKITSLKNAFHLTKPNDKASNGVLKNAHQSLDEANNVN